MAVIHCTTWSVIKKVVMWIIITFQKRWALKFPINKNDRIFRNGLEICDFFLAENFLFKNIESAF